MPRLKMNGYLFVACCISMLMNCTTSETVATVAQWHRYETKFVSSTAYDNPVQETALRIVFSSPEGNVQSVQGFWDGGKTWRVRFMPDSPGLWTWRTECTDADNDGLHNQSGRFQCAASTDDRPIYQKGRLKLYDDGYRLAYDDGTPYFWLACTAWNGGLFSDDESWEYYLNNRVERGFTAIQFVTTQWRGAVGDIDGRTAFSNYDRIEIDPEFFQRLDAKVNAINEHGLVASPVMLWALPSKGDVYSPGLLLSNEQSALLAKYIKARYGAHHVFWLLGGDGKYIVNKETIERWKYIGRQVFGDAPNDGKRGLATLHPCGQNWIRDAYINEPWFDMMGYQSSHGIDEKRHRWVVQQGIANDWKNAPAKPVINLEPAYDTIKPGFDDYVVRRICYWSMLVSPPAGVTYGANSIWAWAFETGAPILGHRNPALNNWREAALLPSGQQMKYLRDVFESTDWWDLYPTPDRVNDQPGIANVDHWIAMATTRDKSAGILYTPVQQEVSLDLTDFGTDLKAAWFDPRTGSFGDDFAVQPQEQTQFQPPATGDWVLVLKKP
jgi:hypothetical protein